MQTRMEAEADRSSSRKAALRQQARTNGLQRIGGTKCALSSRPRYGTGWRAKMLCFFHAHAMAEFPTALDQLWRVGLL